MPLPVGGEADESGDVWIETIAVDSRDGHEEIGIPVALSDLNIVDRGGKMPKEILSETHPVGNAWVFSADAIERAAIELLLTGDGGAITGIFEEVPEAGVLKHFIESCVISMIGATGHDGDSRGAAERLGIEVGEANFLFRYFGDAGRVMIGAAVNIERLMPEVIAHDENDVGPNFSRMGKGIGLWWIMRLLYGSHGIVVDATMDIPEPKGVFSLMVWAIFLKRNQRFILG